MPVVTYSLLRLALFAAAFAGLWAAGMRGWLVAVVAAVVAFALSYVFFRRRHVAAAAWLEQRAQQRAGRSRFSKGVQQDELDEDREAEQVRRTTAGHREADPAP